MMDADPPEHGGNNGNFAKLNALIGTPHILLGIWAIISLPFIVLALAGHLYRAASIRYGHIPARRIPAHQGDLYDDLMERCEHIMQGVNALRVQGLLHAQILAAIAQAGGDHDAPDQLAQRRHRRH